MSSIPFEGFSGDHDAWARATSRLESLRRSRDHRRALEAMKKLERVCSSEENVLPAMMEAMDADVTLGEVGSVFRESFGDWKSPIAI